MGAFGDKFRIERERRGFTLDDVSNVTKISSRMLKAIEDEHFDQLPGGVFNKGFVRAYAKHLGLDDEEAISEYLACLREAQIGAQTGPWEPGRQPQMRTGVEPTPLDAAPRPAAPERRSPDRRSGDRRSRLVESRPQVATPPPPAPVAAPPRVEAAVREVAPARSSPAEVRFDPRQASAIPWRIPAIVLAVIVVGLFFWNRHVRNASAEGGAQTHAVANPVNPSGSVTAAAPGAASPMSSSAQPRSAQSRSAQPPSAQTGSPQTSGVQSPPASSPPSSSASSSSAPAGLKQPVEGEEEDVPSRPAGTPRRPAAASQAPATFTLVIRASETSWISVSADGQTVNQETLIAPAHTSVRATREIVVKAGNAAGVSFLLNGREIPARGNSGEVKTFIFDSAGLRSAPSAQSSEPPR